MSLYILEIDGCRSDLQAESLADAIAQAEEQAPEGYNEVDVTFWVDWRLLANEEEDGDEVVVASGTVAVDPDEPDCSHDDGHDWRSPYSLLGGLRENPGVWGHGGGVVGHEVCVRCGCKRLTDSWAQRLDTGEQGLASVQYETHAFEINNELEAIRWDGDIGSWCDRWFCRAESESFDTEEEAVSAQLRDDELRQAS